MKLSDGVIKAYETRWSMINTFTVSFYFYNGYERTFMKPIHDNLDINLNIVSIQTPEFSNSPIELWIGNRWRTQNSRDNLYKFSITFRDKNQMELYRSFISMYKETGQQFFDNVKFDLLFYKDKDWIDDTDDTLLFTFNECIIESVSHLQFSNDTQNQIAEFTVGFKCISPFVVPNTNDRPAGVDLSVAAFIPAVFSTETITSIFKN